MVRNVTYERFLNRFLNCMAPKLGLFIQRHAILIPRYSAQATDQEIIKITSHQIRVSVCESKGGLCSQWVPHTLSANNPGGQFDISSPPPPSFSPTSYYSTYSLKIRIPTIDVSLTVGTRDYARTKSVDKRCA
jgi:hypothetical protein